MEQQATVWACSSLHHHKDEHIKNKQNKEVKFANTHLEYTKLEFQEQEEFLLHILPLLLNLPVIWNKFADQ